MTSIQREGIILEKTKLTFENEGVMNPAAITYTAYDGISAIGALALSADPNQAVSRTVVYALSCGCPIIAIPIPYALSPQPYCP